MGTASGTGEGVIPTAGQLRAFIAVAEELHFRRAARRLRLAAPSLSETLRRLEDALGLVLLERTSREVMLTDAGAALLPRARDILARLESLHRLGEGFDRPEGESLRIGIYGGGFGELTGPILEAYRARHPQIRLSVGSLGGGPQSFVRSHFDVALTFLPWSDEGTVVHPVATEPRVMLLPASHPAAGEEARIGDFLDEPFMALVPGVPEIRDYWLAVDERDGVQPRVGGGASTVADVVHQIRYQGLVTTAARSLGAAFSVPGTAMAMLTDLEPCTMALAVRLGDERMAVQDFVALSHETAERLADSLPGVSPALSA